MVLNEDVIFSGALGKVKLLGMSGGGNEATIAARRSMTAHSIERARSPDFEIRRRILGPGRKVAAAVAGGKRLIRAANSH